MSETKQGTAIEWTHRPGTKGETWNPVTGCTKVSPGCAYCYAERLSQRFGWSKAAWTPVNEAQNIVLHPERLEQPLRWREPRTVFVNSMSDLFHELIPDEYIDRVFAVMALTPQHTYQVLTKRPERMREYMVCRPPGVAADRATAVWMAGAEWRKNDGAPYQPWPLPNVWLGVTCENQHWADERIPVLLDTPAAVRFVSLEPLLGPIDLHPRPAHQRDRCIVCGAAAVLHPDGWRELSSEYGPAGLRWTVGHEYRTRGLDWVICGGESGGPENRRLVERCDHYLPELGYWTNAGHCTRCASQPRDGLITAGTGWRPKPEALGWVRSLRDQCQGAGVPYFFKQFGGPKPTSGGRLLDGRTWDEYPSGEEARQP